MRNLRAATLLGIWLGGFALAVILTVEGSAVLLLLGLLAGMALLLLRFRSHFGLVSIKILLLCLVPVVLLSAGYLRLRGNSWAGSFLDSLLYSWPLAVLASIRRPSVSQTPDTSHAA
jgi:hypothetical protein